MATSARNDAEASPGSERTAPPLLLQSRLKRTEGPNGPVTRGVGREAVLVCNLHKGLLGILP